MNTNYGIFTQCNVCHVRTKNVDILIDVLRSQKCNVTLFHNGRSKTQTELATCSSEETESWSSEMSFITWSTGRLRNSSLHTTSLQTDIIVNKTIQHLSINVMQIRKRQKVKIKVQIPQTCLTMAHRHTLSSNFSFTCTSAHNSSNGMNHAFAFTAKLILILPTPEGQKTELTKLTGYIPSCFTHPSKY